MFSPSITCDREAESITVKRNKAQVSRRHSSGSGKVVASSATDRSDLEILISYEELMSLQSLALNSRYSQGLHKILYAICECEDPLETRFF